MTNLPENWAQCKLDTICSVYQPKTISTKELVEDGRYAVYGANGEIGRYNKYNHTDSEVLITCRGATCGRINVSRPFSWINGNAMVVHPHSNNLRKDFLYYYLTSINFAPYISGSAQPQITRVSLQPLELLIPPLAEQGRIVAKIEELFAGIDAGVENLKSVKNQIALYRQSVLKSAFDGTLYKTTEWNFTSIGTVCDINPKTVLPNFSDDSIVSFLPMPTVEAETGAFSPETVEYKKVKKGYTKFQNNDVLFAKITPCMENGKSCVVHDLIQGVGFGSTEFHILRCHAGMLPEYVFYFVVQKVFRSKAIPFMTGAVGQKRVPADYLRDCEIPVPTLAEQERIVAEIESRFERADALETAVDRALSDAEKLKQAVLKKAFSGELVPQNPDDEPASVLLDRIRAARASELPAKKGKRKKTEVDSQL